MLRSPSGGTTLAVPLDAEPPYRSDRDALLAENQLLRRRLTSLRRTRFPFASLVLALTHLVLREALAGWLNGSSDTRFWVGIVAVYGPLVGAVVALVVWARSPGDPTP